jgi:hypothetical protein
MVSALASSSLPEPESRPIRSSPIPPKAVPYIPRPVRFADGGPWESWLVTDQRAVADRTDDLVYQSTALTAPVRIGGAPVADIYAATTGTDADWVVKLIDVYPDEYPSQPELGGYHWRSRWTFFVGGIVTALSSLPRFQPISPSDTASSYPRRTTFFCPATGW